MRWIVPPWEPDSWTAIRPVNGGSVWGVSMTSGAVFRVTGTDVERAELTGGSLLGITATDSDAWAFGVANEEFDRSLLLHHENDAWTRVNRSSDPGGIISVASLPAGRALLQYRSGALEFFDNGIFVGVPATGDDTVGAVSGTGVDDVSTVASLQRVAHWNGDQWATSPPWPETPNDVFPSAFVARGTDAAVVVQGEVFRFDGTGWSNVHHFGNGVVGAIAISDDDSLYIADCDPFTLYAAPFGEKPVLVATSTVPEMGESCPRSLSIASDGVVWLAGDRGLIARANASTLDVLSGGGARESFSSLSSLDGRLVGKGSTTQFGPVGGADAIPRVVDGLTLEVAAVVSDDDIWMFGEGRSAHWTGGATAFAPTHLPFFGQAASAAASQVDEIWLGGQPGVSHFDGMAWQLVGDPEALPLGGIREFAAVAPDDVWSVTSCNACFGSVPALAHYDGLTWSPEPSAYYSDRVAAAATDDVWTVDYPHLYHFDGASWTFILRPTDVFVDVVAPAGSGRAWASGGGFAAFFDGLVWGPAEPVGSNLSDVTMFAVGVDDVWLEQVDGSIDHRFGGTWATVAASGHLIQALDRSIWLLADNALAKWNGATETFEVRVALPRSVDALGFSLVSADDVWATSVGELDRWDGNTWTRHPTGTNLQLPFVAADAAGAIAVGSDGAIASIAGSLVATSTLVGPAADFKAVWGGPLEGWAVTDDLIVSIVTGQPSAQPSPVPGRLTDIDGVDVDNMWATAEGAILQLTPEQDWHQVYATNDSMVSLDVVDATHVWALGLNTLAHYDGGSWSEVTAPPGVDAFAADVDHVWFVVDDGILEADANAFGM